MQVNIRQDSREYTQEILNEFDVEALECLHIIRDSISSLKEQLSSLSIQRSVLQENLTNARKVAALIKKKALRNLEDDPSSSFVLNEAILDVIKFKSYKISNLIKFDSVCKDNSALVDITSKEVNVNNNITFKDADKTILTSESGKSYDNEEYSDRNKNTIDSEVISTRNYVQLAPPQKSDELIVTLTILLSPYLMFFRRSGSYARPFHMLLMEINKFYSDANNLFQCHEDLVVSSPCIVRTHEDQYERARVVSSDSESNVNVFLVDYGVSKIVDKGDIFHIPDKFLKFPTMSLELKMAGLIPHKCTSWSSLVSDILKSKLKDKEVTIKIFQEPSDKSSIAEALIYELIGNEEICLNHWLVFEGLAMFKENAFYDDERVIKKSSILKDQTTDKQSLTKGSYSCKIINFVSPASIFIRKLTDEDSFYHLHQDMQSHYSISTSRSHEVKWHQGSLAAFYHKESNTWVRAKIVRKTGLKVDLFLLDSGIICKSKTDFLEPLLQKFKMKNLTEEVCLSGIFPNSNSGKWSKSANKLVNNYLNESNMVADIEQDGRAGHDRVPVKMSVSVVKDSKVVEVDIHQELVKEGFGNFVVHSKPRVASTGQTRKNDFVVDMFKFYEEEKIQQWPEHPELKLNSQLLSCATHVDWDGFIYLILNSSKLKLELMNEDINNMYQDSSQAEEDKFWTTGQAAIAKWHVDNKWYRASVSSVQPNRCRVKLVDYGTEETIFFTSMRKTTFHQDVPVHCFRFKLDNLSPVNEDWSEDELIVFHESVVDKEVLVFPKTKKGDSQGCFYTGKLKVITTGEDLTDILAKKNITRVVDDNYDKQ